MERANIMKVVTTFWRHALIVAGACLMFACTKPSAAENGANAAPITAKAIASPSNSAGVLTAQNPEDKMARIKADEAKKLVADGKAIIIDVRGSDAYKMAHIKGALDVPLSRLEGDDFKGLPKDKRIITYCTCPSENSSARAVVLLEKAGFKGGAALVGGMQAWETAGGEIEKAPPEPPKKAEHGKKN